MVARQSLTLFVWVRILVPQPKPDGSGLSEASGFFVAILGFEPSFDILVPQP